MTRHRATARGPSSRGSAVALRSPGHIGNSVPGLTGRPGHSAPGAPTIRAALRIDCPSARSHHEMFGHHKKKASGGDSHISVDATLEGDIAQVEQSVADYL